MPPHIFSFVLVAPPFAAAPPLGEDPPFAASPLVPAAGASGTGALGSRDGGDAVAHAASVTLAAHTTSASEREPNEANRDFMLVLGPLLVLD
jgi:hypothetical protein